MQLAPAGTRPRRILSLALVAGAATLGLSGLVALAPAAHADSGATLTVTGTSDVYDSNLVQTVIKPGFQAAYPGITLNYVSQGTGAAIAYAEAGSASALIVHAESLENTFVSQGYSLEKAGRAVFYGDYVLAGHAADPAGVATHDPNNIEGAFAAIAAAGSEGNATFVSRGGTPGTTVQEHQIWGLVEQAQKSTTSPVELCQVGSASGGGYVPATNPNSDGTCPSSVTYPSWYHVTGLTQGPNVENADACNYSPTSASSCYVFTDRGTLQYLQSQNEATNLQIVTRNNSGSAPGGSTELINTFHAYAVNPSAVPASAQSGVNTVAATDFLNWLTSPAAQQAIGAYLASGSGGAPFLPDAHPQVSTSTPPSSVAAGKPVTITGKLTNVVPGTPPLANEPVQLHYTPSADPSSPTTVASTTDSAGAFRFDFTPPAVGSYTVSTNDVDQLERADLTPTFSDLLEGTATPSLGTVAVAGALHLTKVTIGTGELTGTATVSKDAYRDGVLQLYAAKKTSSATPKLRYIAAVPVRVGATSLSFRYYLPAGYYAYQLHYQNKGVITAAVTVVHTARIR